MAHFLRGYDYEPECTAEEVEARSKAAVRRSNQWSMSWLCRSSHEISLGVQIRVLDTIEMLETAALRSAVS